MSYPYDGLSDKELTSIITGHSPWPIHQKAHPPMVENPGYIFKDEVRPPITEARDMWSAARGDMERQLLFGLKEGSRYMDAPPDEWTQYKHLTRFVGGFVDTPYWNESHVAMLTREVKLALIEKLNQLDKEIL